MFQTTNQKVSTQMPGVLRCELIEVNMKSIAMHFGHKRKISAITSFSTTAKLSFSAQTHTHTIPSQLGNSG